MAIYPDYKINSFKEKTSKPVLKSAYQGGYEQKRPKFTRQIKTFTLGYVALTVAEANALEQFIMDNQGKTFTFVHPLTLVSYDVTYEGDDVEIAFVTPQFRSTNIVLKEV